MWLPEWLYKLLPHLYAATGLSAICLGNNAMSAGSGLLLVVTAFLVWKLRSKHRSASKPRW